MSGTPSKPCPHCDGRGSTVMIGSHEGQRTMLQNICGMCNGMRTLPIGNIAAYASVRISAISSKGGR